MIVRGALSFSILSLSINYKLLINANSLTTLSLIWWMKSSFCATSYLNSALIFENSYLFFKTAHVESQHITLEFIAGFHSISARSIYTSDEVTFWFYNDTWSVM